MGNTISFAGIPKMNAVKMYPSNPINCANGLRKFAIIVNKLSPFIPILANSQMTNPAGAATDMALPSTNNVLSKMDLTTIFPTWGFLYGDNSSTNDDGTPFNIVFESILDTNSVKNIPKSITKITASVDTSDAFNPCIVPAIKILAIVIKKGNLPVARNKVIG